MELSKLAARGADGRMHAVLKTTAGQVSDSSLGFRAQHGTADYSLEEDGTPLRLDTRTGDLVSIDGKTVFTPEPAER